MMKRALTAQGLRPRPSAARRGPAPESLPFSVLLVLATLVLGGCADNREPLESQLKTIRSYGWPATVVDPDPDWNPGKHILIARTIGGFCTLEEGGQGVRNFAADDRRESHHPRWLNREQFVFGPGWNARRAVDGSISTPSEGITVVTMADDRPTSKVLLCDRGTRPQPAGGALVVAQQANRILFIDNHGSISEFGEGFEAVPQADGPGLCWRDTPVFEPDWWTGRTGPGSMYVRWQASKVDKLPGGMQAAWTRRGTVLATVLDAPAAAGQAWWGGGTHIIHLATPGGLPQLVRAGAHDPAPHPIADLLAWTGEDGGVWMGTIRADGWSERIADAGSRPRWSHDGLRLCWIQPPTAGSQLPAIRVMVLAVR